MGTKNNDLIVLILAAIIFVVTLPLGILAELLKLQK
jgi:hypothetical protein